MAGGSDELPLCPQLSSAGGNFPSAGSLSQKKVHSHLPRGESAAALFFFLSADRPLQGANTPISGNHTGFLRQL